MIEQKRPRCAAYPVRVSVFRLLVQAGAGLVVVISPQTNSIALDYLSSRQDGRSIMWIAAAAVLREISDQVAHGLEAGRVPLLACESFRRRRDSQNVKRLDDYSGVAKTL